LTIKTSAPMNDSGAASLALNVPVVSSAEPWPSATVAWYAVFVLGLTLLVNFLDRQILTLLVEPIKQDLSLSDTQISLIMGFAFIVFYVIWGLPIARLVDIGSRRLILGIGVAFWSVMTAVCGFATTFWQLFIARIGVGVGEACTGPATFSLLADLFPREKLPRAIAVLNFGFITGTGFALIIGGTVVGFLSQTPEITIPIIGAVRSWQATFFVIGLPGLIVAALTMTLIEPKRRGRVLLGSDGAAIKPKAPPVRDVVSFLLSNWRTYGSLFVGLGLKVILSLGSAVWVPAFYIRTFGWSIAKVGLVQGSIWLILGPLGAAVGAYLAERWTRKGYDDANMRVVLWSSICIVPVTVLFPLMPTEELAVCFGSLVIFIAGWVLGPQNAALQVITPNQMRGQVTALFLFVFNVIGFGLGPTFIALITDYIYGGPQYLSYSMSTAAAVLGPTAVLVIWLGLKHYGASVARAKQWD
jgi:MFS family permease